MKKKSLGITVGASIFSSASWDPEVEPFDTVPGYAAWCREPQLSSPAARRSYAHREVTGEDVLDRVREVLRDRQPKTLPFVFEVDGERRRYCAEITTLLELYQYRENPGDETIEEFARCRYDRIELFHIAERDDDGEIAAPHLREQLHTITGVYPTLVPTGGRSLAEQIVAFQRELLKRRDREMELIVSGGYKGFAVVCGRMMERFSPRWTCSYLFEQDLGLVQDFGDGQIKQRNLIAGSPDFEETSP